MLPDVLAATRTLLLDRTRANANVSTEPPRGGVAHYLQIRRVGGPIGPAHNESDTARIHIDCEGPTEAEAYLLALEVRDVFMPPAQVVGTFVGAVGDTFFSGGELETGPSRMPDPPGGGARYLIGFLVHYARAA